MPLPARAASQDDRARAIVDRRVAKWRKARTPSGASIRLAACRVPC